MNNDASDPGRLAAQVPGLERYLRSRLFNTLTRLLLILVLVGGVISASTPGSHFLETASICCVVALALAAWFVGHYLQLVRRLRTNPAREVARLHKRSRIKNAGFVDDSASSAISRAGGEHRRSSAPEDDYAALRDVDVLGQKSAEGLNRTDDPSRGPIE